MEKRLFIGIKIIPSLKFINLFKDLRQLFPGSGIKWVSPDNIHLTLKFLGQTEISKIEEIEDIIRNTIETLLPFELVIKNIGYFPGNKKINVIWLGTDKNETIFKLADLLEEKLFKAGFKKDEHSFNPHITLARIKPGENAEKLTDFIHKHKVVCIQTSFVKEIILFESNLTQKGPVYIPVMVFSLKKAT
ncbi:MAG: RNA 2',3'-cyclic phosphodiesterase [Bacteroidales bacterium]